MRAKGEAANVRIYAVALALFFCASPLPVAATPPTVVKAIPDDGATNVDPALKELRVVFDQAMSPNGMSIVGGGPSFPKLIGEALWENDRTLVFAWRLEPGHDYWLSINNENFTNFRGTNGESSVPHPISFHTAGVAAKTNVESAPESVGEEGAFTQLKNAIDEDYSYRDLRHVNWDERFKELSSELKAGRIDFYKAAISMLAPAQDIHIWLMLPSDVEMFPFQRRAPWNVVTAYLPRQIHRWQKRNNLVSSGVFEDGIRYVFIKSWTEENGSDLEPAFEVISDATEINRPLIIDVRANGGGSEDLAQQFAGCFVDHPVIYAKNINRQHGKWFGPFDRELQPNKARPHFKGRVAVLMGQGTVSSSESFVMMMKQCPTCILVGDHTAGCSGNPKPMQLGNGVIVFLPSWKDLRLDGTGIEGEGFAPDVQVKTNDESFEKNDPVVEAALEVLRKPGH